MDDMEYKCGDEPVRDGRSSTALRSRSSSSVGKSQGGSNDESSNQDRPSIIEASKNNEGKEDEEGDDDSQNKAKTDEEQEEGEEVESNVGEEDIRVRKVKISLFNSSGDPLFRMVHKVE